MIVNFATVAGASGAALLAVHAVTFAVGRRIGRYNVVDVAWGLGFIAVALVAAILGDGDACVWWGLWLITITGWWALATVLSPLLMTYFLVYATGARLTEKYMRGRRGFDEYQARTSFFIPRPPQIRAK